MRKAKKKSYPDYITFESRVVENGELMSESMITFTFRIDKDGNYKLVRIMGAG
ncbi:hypothetical protein [Chitinophaga caseinilytica]|uniref:Uncharacterized protein n=1 Tax=Chitinophaga caseinilytica TaxID=2267521 RepID=A0ABZ2Z1I0_9BACT